MSHRDTPDGCKALVGGLFHEFAVFRTRPLSGRGVPEPGAFIWVREGIRHLLDGAVGARAP